MPKPIQSSTQATTFRRMINFFHTPKIVSVKITTEYPDSIFMIYDPKNNSSACEDTILVCAEVENIKIDLKKKELEIKQIITMEKHIEGCIKFMTEKTHHHKLRLILDNPNYASKNFKEIKCTQSDPKNFIALFDEGEIVFSNRYSGPLDMRGDTLKKLLSAGTYETMRDLISLSYLTKNDPFIAAAAMAVVKTGLSELEASISDKTKNEQACIIDKIKYQLSDHKFKGIPLREFNPEFFPY